MRVLASFAFSFAAAIFLAIYAGMDVFLPLLGGVLALLAAAVGLVMRKKSPARTRIRLILFGLAAGFLWTALYMVIFFQPACDLDGRTVRLTAIVTDWPQEGLYGGCTVPVRAETEGWVKVSAIL